MPVLHMVKYYEIKGQNGPQYLAITFDFNWGFGGKGMTFFGCKTMVVQRLVEVFAFFAFGVRQFVVV